MIKTMGVPPDEELPKEVSEAEEDEGQKGKEARVV